MLNPFSNVSIVLIPGKHGFQQEQVESEVKYILENNGPQNIN